MNPLEKAWYSRARWLLVLRPLSSLFTALVNRRRQKLRRYRVISRDIPVPVVIVGNISVGGTGKTPLVIALIEHLREAGYTPGVISRGYGAQADTFPFAVRADTPAEQGGDEPCLIVRRTGVPLYIDPDRVSAARALLAAHPCDVLISDDGLQHYALPRDIELAVIDGARGLGNGRCLPEGPLREPPERLACVDWVVINGAASPEGLPDLKRTPALMHLQPGVLWQLQGDARVAAGEWQGSRQVNAVAGIGHPARFFDTLRALGFDPVEHPFPDHAGYTPEQLTFDDSLPVIMTEKDAVKCQDSAPEDTWVLPVEARLDPAFIDTFLNQLAECSAQMMDNHNGSKVT